MGGSHEEVFCKRRFVLKGVGAALQHDGWPDGGGTPPGAA